MTSQFKFQGSLKALAVSAVAAVLSMPAMDVNAQRVPTATQTSGGRGDPPARGRLITKPIRNIIVRTPCAQGGPGITPC